MLLQPDALTLSMTVDVASPLEKMPKQKTPESALETPPLKVVPGALLSCVPMAVPVFDETSVTFTLVMVALAFWICRPTAPAVPWMPPMDEGDCGPRSSPRMLGAGGRALPPPSTATPTALV